MGQTSRKANFNDSSPLGRLFSSRREAALRIGGRDCVGHLSHECGWMRYQRLVGSRYRSRSRKNAIAPPSIPRPHRANWDRSCINFLCLRGDSRFLSQSFKLLAVRGRRTSNYLLSPSKTILSSAAISLINCLGFCSFN